MLLGLLLLLFVLCLYRIRIDIRGFHDDYLSKAKTDAIRGIFIMLVVCKHAMGYLNDLGYEFEATGDNVFASLFNCTGQLLVVMFLFYSGYGIGESYKKKGEAYLHGYPRKRILPTLLNFDVAVIAFVILALLIGRPVTMSQSLLSLTGWENVGNSNWYIFVILCCYAFAWVALRLPLARPAYRVALLFALCLALLLILSRYKDGYWFDTLLTFPTGFLFSTYKEGLERFVKRWYWGVLAVLAMLFLVQFYGYYNEFYYDRLNLTYNAFCITFALLVVVLTMKVGINNQPLQWLGRHLFPIYIYMRIPMILLVEKQPEFVLAQPAAFIVISLAATLLIAGLYRYWRIRL